MGNKKKIVEILEWDTIFFGFPVAQVINESITIDEMEEILVFCKSNKVRLLQFKCDSNYRQSIIVAEKFNFHFADSRITFSRNLNDPVLSNSDINSFYGRMADIKDIDSLQSLVEGLFTLSRYYFDNNFERERVHTFYSVWLGKAVQGRFDDWVYCRYENSEPLGFCTIREKNLEIPRIGLIGVSPKVVGNAVGKKLLMEVLYILYNKKYKWVEVVTQGRNYVAQRMYQKAGFLTKHIGIYYHKWFEI